MRHSWHGWTCMMTDLSGLTVYNHLAKAAVPLQASAAFGDGLAGSLWDRDEVAHTRYETPTHHTLSLYVSAGDTCRRKLGQQFVPSFGAGSLCLMPSDMTSEWDVGGPVKMLHLYISRTAFQRAVLETTGLDPRHVELRDVPYFQDHLIQSVMQNVILPLDWNEPAERLSISYAAQTLLTYLATRHTNRLTSPSHMRGGLPANSLNRVKELIHARLASPLSIIDLAECAGLTPYHFARSFKRSTGESPHAFVLRCRIEHAKEILSQGASLAQAALCCGFSSQSHFTARFRSITGLTPGQFVRARKG